MGLNCQEWSSSGNGARVVLFFHFVPGYSLFSKQARGMAFFGSFHSADREFDESTDCLRPRRRLEKWSVGHLALRPSFRHFLTNGLGFIGDKNVARTNLVPALISRTGLAVASVNYRLSPREPDTTSHQYRHPTHMIDVIDALQLLTGPRLVEVETERDRWDRNRLVLIGQVCSCSAVLPSSSRNGHLY
jgi:hypothetical protein